MKYTGSQIILEVLKSEKVDTVFGYPGGAVLPLYDKLYHEKDIQHILVRHEQGGTHGAEGYAKSTGKVGVVISTSGPGATNTVTGIADAYLDSTPLVVITGQVARPLIGTDGFQETDIVGITSPITKSNSQIRNIEDIYKTLRNAFHIARSGRPGPVLVDIPKDIQAGSMEFNIKDLEEEYRKEYPDDIIEIPSLSSDDLATIKGIVKDLSLAKKPYIYTGGGLQNQQASKLLREFLKIAKIPHTSSFMGLGVVENSNEYHLGFLGMHGTYEANMALYECDYLLCMGARLSDRTTGRVNNFAKNAKFAHIDIDENMIDKIKQSDVSVVSDSAVALKEIIREWQEQTQSQSQSPSYKDWWQQIAKWKEKNSYAYKKTANNHALKPQEVLERLAEHTKDIKTHITTEVGQHQMFVGQFFPLNEPRSLITSGGLGTMGFGVPSSLGVAVANPDSTVLSIAGDGSFMMNLQELATIQSYNLNVKTIIFNNATLGMVHQWQDIIYEERFSSSEFSEHTNVHPDFIKLGESFHMPSSRVTHIGELDEHLKKMLDHKGGYLLEILIDPDEHVMPMLPPGASINEMILRELDCQSDSTTTEHSQEKK